MRTKFFCTALLTAAMLYGQQPVKVSLPKLGKLKEQALGIPAGSPLTVQLAGSDGKKKSVFGRMGNLTNDGFSLKTISNGNLEDLNVNFADVQKLKPGPKQGLIKRVSTPLLAGMSLATLAGTVVAIVKK